MRSESPGQAQTLLIPKPKHLQGGSQPELLQGDLSRSHSRAGACPVATYPGMMYGEL